MTDLASELRNIKIYQHMKQMDVQRSVCVTNVVIDATQQWNVHLLFHRLRSRRGMRVLLRQLQFWRQRVHCEEGRLRFSHGESQLLSQTSGGECERCGAGHRQRLVCILLAAWNHCRNNTTEKWRKEDQNENGAKIVLKNASRHSKYKYLTNKQGNMGTCTAKTYRKHVKSNFYTHWNQNTL